MDRYEYEEQLNEWLEGEYTGNAEMVLAYFSYDPHYNATAYTFEELASLAEDTFWGEYPSHADFAREIAEQLGINIPNELEPYIDWKQWGDDLLLDDFYEENGFYFRAN